MIKWQWVAVPAGLCAAGVAAIVFGLTRGAGSAPPRALPTPFSSAAARPSSSASPTSGTGDRTSTTSSAGRSPLDGTSPPVRVRIAAPDVDARVVPVGLSGHAVQVPDKPSTLGWWAGGPAPGAPHGTAVIDGHVDSAASGPGALFHLDTIKPGSRIEVVGADGRAIDYRVTTLSVVPKSAGLRADLFATTGAPRLALVTCGGPFDERTKSYLDNIVATALPV